MRDGGACASLTLAAFFEGLLRLRTLSLSDRVRRSTQLANERVHAFARGQGGATLSAVVVEPSLAPCVVNVGDSVQLRWIALTIGIEPARSAPGSLDAFRRVTAARGPDGVSCPLRPPQA